MKQTPWSSGYLCLSTRSSRPIRIPRWSVSDRSPLSRFHRDKINACQNIKLNNTISGGVFHSQITVFCHLSFQVFMHSAILGILPAFGSIHLWARWSVYCWEPFRKCLEPPAGICPQAKWNCPGWSHSPDSYWVMVWNEARLILIPAYVQMFPPLFVVGLNGLRQIWNKLRMPCGLMSTLEMLYIGCTCFLSNCFLRQI